MREIEFFYDYGSPFTYLVNTQLAAIADRHQVQFNYRPMLLGAVFKAAGAQSPAFETCAAKRNYGAVHLRRLVKQYGCPFTFNRHFPVHTLLCARVAHAAQQRDCFAAAHRALFDGVWVQDRNLGEPEEVQRTLDEAGLDGAALVQAASDPAVKQALRETTDEAVRAGVFGAPTFKLDDELFFGNDHLQYLLARLQEAS